MSKFALAIMALLATGIASASVTLPPIPHGSQSQIIHLPFVDYANPGECPATDVTSASEDFTLTVFGDKRGFSDVFTETDGTLEDITTMGTFATPTATKARFEVTAAGSCVYEVHLPDAAFAGTNDDRLIIEAQNGTSDLVLEMVYQIDLTGVAVGAVADAVWTEPTAGYTTADTFGARVNVTIPAVEADTQNIQSRIPASLVSGRIDANVGAAATDVLTADALNSDAVTEIQTGLATAAALATVDSEVGVIDGIVDDILVDTGTTLPAAIAAGGGSLFDGAVDTGGVTSQTVLVSVAGPAVNDTHIGRSMCIRDASDSEMVDCALITDYVASTQTWTLANALKFTVVDADEMFIPANDTNVKAMNNSEVCGNGQTGTPWTGNGC